jgi:PKD repeat protein
MGRWLLICDMRYSLIAVMAVLGVAYAAAQRHHETVVVGMNTALRIRSGLVQVLALPPALASERVLASVNQAETGLPEFYVTNTSILASDGTVLTNRLQPGSTSSLDVRAIIVPRPLFERRYYVFAVVREGSQQSDSSYLRMAEIEMPNNGGFARLVDGPRTIASNVGAGITTVRHCDGRRWWLITHHRSSKEFRAQQVTAAGVSEVVVTTGNELGITPEAGTDAWLNSFLASNAQGTFVALLAQPGGHVDMYGFDNQSGKLTSYRELTRQQGSGQMMGTFSPDGTKFYWNDRRLVLTVDLSQPMAAWTPQPLFPIDASDESEAGLFTGPDGRIYVSNGRSVIVITRPNNAHPNTGFRNDEIDLASGGNVTARSFAFLPLPQQHLLFLDQGRICAPPLPAMQFDSVACLGTTVEYTDRTQMRPTSWRWSFQGGTPSQHNGPTPPPIRYSFPGIYRVRLVVSNDFGETEVERYVRVENPPVLDLDSVSPVCGPSVVRLAARGANRYQWFPNSLVSNATASQTEARVQRSTWIYIRGWSVNQCEVLDSIYVRVDSVDLQHIRDTAICEGGIAQFGSIDADEVLWQPADGVSDVTSRQPILMPRETTTYTIAARKGTCTFTREVAIEVVPDGQERIRIDTVCIGDTIELASVPGGVWAGLPAASVVEDRRVRVPISGSFSARLLYDRGGACRLRRDYDVVAAAPAVGRLSLDDAPYEVGKERRIRIGSVPPLVAGELRVRLVLPAALMVPVVALGSQVSSTVVGAERHVVIRVQGGGNDLAIVRGQVMLAPLGQVDIRLEVDSSSNCVRLSDTELLDAAYTGCSVRMRPVVLGEATAAAVRVWPQPVGRGAPLFMDAGGAGNIGYRLVDALGRVHDVGTAESGSSVELQRSIAAGLYSLLVTVGNQTSVVPVLVE